MSNWSELKIESPLSLSEVVAAGLWEVGCAGITEGNPTDKWQSLTASFENLDGDGRALVEQTCREIFQRADAPDPTLNWREVPNENWKETHRRFYPPQPLSAKFYLVPAWQAGELEVPAGFLPIVMEPGRAFGTGLHQSTRLALWLMEEYLAEKPGLGVIDVGTGSGILALAAKKLGETKVEGTDNDPEAIEVAIENAELNQTPDIRFSVDTLETFPEASFGMVVANILLRTHLELMAGYRRVLKPGGVLILSGLLVEQRQVLEPELHKMGFARNKSKIIDEWESVSYLLIK